MASIEKRGGKYRAIFRYEGQKYSGSLGTDKRQKAELARGQIERNLELVSLGMLAVPDDGDVFHFFLTGQASVHSDHNSKPSDSAAPATGRLSISKPYLIHKLIRYFKPQRLLDPMVGSGTCKDVCLELAVECETMDIRRGKDAADPSAYDDIDPVDMVWMHPPYWRMIKYNDDPRCLSNAPTLDAFLNRMQLVLRNCRNTLTLNGKIAVLIGGYSDNGNYQPIPQLLVERALREDLWPACTEIIRLQHGNTSSRKIYHSSFIPGLHDTCLIFRKMGSP